MKRILVTIISALFFIIGMKGEDVLNAGGVLYLSRESCNDYIRHGLKCTPIDIYAYKLSDEKLKEEHINIEIRDNFGEFYDATYVKINPPFYGYYVYGIKERAFENTPIESVVFRTNKKTQEIKCRAFYGCNSLADFNTNEMHSSMILCDSALMNCENIEHINLKRIEKIGKHVFKNCLKLCDVSIDSNLGAIGVGIFEGCDNLKTLTLNSVTAPKVLANSFTEENFVGVQLFVPTESIELYQKHPIWGKFQNISGIESKVETLCYKVVTKREPWDPNDPFGPVFIPAEEETDTAMIVATEGKPYYGDIVIPDEVTISGKNYIVAKIGENAFENSYIRSIKFGANIKHIRNYAFKGSDIEDMEIPETVDSLGAGAFSCCKINKLKIKTKKIEFFGGVFAGADFVIKRLEIPEGVKRLGGGIPQDIEYLHLPSSLNFVSTGALYDLYHIKRIESAAVNPPVLENIYPDRDGVFSEHVYANAAVWVPRGSVSKYKRALYWSRLPIVGRDFGSVVTATDTGITVAATGDGIEVSGADEEAVAEVYTVSGQLVYRGTERQIPVSKGIYIVRIAGNALKVAVK